MKVLAVTMLALVAAGAVAQQGQERTVQVTVTSVSGRDVFLDLGRDAGLAPGVVVRLFPPGTAGIDAEVRSVSSTSARAELPPGVPDVPVGTRGEANVVIAAAPASPPRPTPKAVPEHPPWTRREGARTPDQPLLVPTYSQRPDERPASLVGRLFAFGQWNRDTAGDQRNDYLLGRLGVRADGTNFLGYGERTRFSGEVDERRVMLPDAPDETDRNGRLDLLSVAFGTEQWAPTGVEIGRFLSPHLPEIGLVDGVEVVRRFEHGLRFGAGFGAYPRPFPSRETGEDTGIHLFFDYTANAKRTFAATIGLQKTWHEGAPDRDLLLLRADGVIAERVRWFASAKVDLYTGSDTVKSRDVDLTELFASLRWDGSDLGAGVSVSRFTWPELKRAEYQSLPVELVRDGHVDRLSLQGWWRTSKRLRFGARADLWQDQDDEGTSFGLDGDLAEVIGAGSNLGVSLYEADGGYSSGPGARLLLRGPVGGGYWRVGYRWHRYELGDLVTGPETLTRQSAEVGLSHPIGATGDLDFAVERWFGDREDAWALGLYLQWRF
ncbi:MAG: hypothetical protein JNK78_09235 [Planctomycetes bacterium]|nr:hypothetical protein [Planctomycetota bacterium]